MDPATARLDPATTESSASVAIANALGLLLKEQDQIWDGWDLIHEYDTSKLVQQQRMEQNQRSIGAARSKEKTPLEMLDSLRSSAFEMVHRVEMPMALVEQYGTMQRKCFMGLFPSIKRAWFSVDNQLYIWNYTSSKDNDFIVCPPMPSTIVNVELFRPVQGALDDEYEYALVVACTLKVQWFVLHLNRTSSEISLVPTKISVNTDTIPMLKMVSGFYGRLFLAGRDGCLYELMYANFLPKPKSKPQSMPTSSSTSLGAGSAFQSPTIRASGLTARPKLVNHSRSYLGAMIPSAIRSRLYREDPLIDIAVDEDRGILYTLSESGIVKVYKLDKDAGKSAPLVFPRDSFMRDGSIPPSEQPMESLAQQTNPTPMGPNPTTSPFGTPISFLTQAPSDPRNQFMEEIGYLDIHAEIRRFASNEPRAILGIYVVPSIMSTNIQLVIVSSLSERFYLSVNLVRSHIRIFGSRSAPPWMPDNVGFAFANQPIANGAPDNLLQQRLSVAGTQVHAAFWARGIMLFADSHNPMSDSLIAIIPERKTGARPADVSNSPPATWLPLAAPSVSTGAGLIEQVVNIPLLVDDGEPIKVWAIAATDLTEKTGSQPSPYGSSVLLNISPDTVEEYVVLTNIAVHVYRRVRLLDLLRFLVLSTAGGGQVPQIELQNRLYSLFAEYGTVEATKSCLQLALEMKMANRWRDAGGLAFSRFAQPSDMLFDGFVRTFFFVAAESLSQEVAASTSQFGGSVLTLAKKSSFEFKTKELSYGTLRFLAMIFKSFWRRYLAYATFQNGVASLELISHSDLEIMRSALEIVVYVLSTGPNSIQLLPRATAAQGFNVGNQQPATGSFGVLPTPARQQQQQQDLQQRIQAAWHSEVSTISSIRNLLLQCMEAIRILELLHEYRFSQVVALRLAEDQRLELKNTEFGEFAVGDAGKWISTVLIEALFSALSSDQRTVESVSRMLKEFCPKFYSETDASLQHGLSLLRQAHQTRTVDRDSRRALMNARSAVEALMGVASKVGELSSVCDELFQSGAVRESILLALQAETSAENVGDQQHATIARTCIFGMVQACILRSSLPVVTSSGDTQSEAGLEVLRNEALTAALSAGSDAYNDQLYTFLLSLGSVGSDELLQLKSPKIESFLQRTDLSLLWRYYARHSRFLEAAVVLQSLADDETVSMELDERITCLANSLHNANAAASFLNDARANTFARLVSDKLEVAKVQLRAISELNRVGESGTLYVSEESNVEPQAVDPTEIQQVADELRSQLLDLTEIYNAYAQPWSLWETQLDVLRCASHHDEYLVRNLWNQIIHVEYLRSKKVGGPTFLEQRIRALGRDFAGSDLVFPVSYLVDVLERLTFVSMKTDPSWSRMPLGWVFRCMLDLGIDMDRLLNVYYDLVVSSDRLDCIQGIGVWSESRESVLYLVSVIEQALFVANKLTSQHPGLMYAPRQEITRLIEQSLDALQQLEPSKETRALERSINDMLAVYIGS